VRFDELGQVLVKSPCVTLGYYKDAEQTAGLLTPDGFIRTGDLGQCDEQGRLKLTGRIKEQFKTSKGKYVAPAPIENRLGNHAMVEASMVTGAGLAQPFAIVMLPLGEWQKHESASSRDALSGSLDQHRKLINECLDPHERLDFLVVVPEQWTVEGGHLTPTLKVKRAVLESAYGPKYQVWARQRKGVIWG
jgi:long-chain acyl-CoA synthetase